MHRINQDVPHIEKESIISKWHSKSKSKVKCQSGEKIQTNQSTNVGMSESIFIPPPTPIPVKTSAHTTFHVSTWLVRTIDCTNRLLIASFCTINFPFFIWFQRRKKQTYVQLDLCRISAFCILFSYHGLEVSLWNGRFLLSSLLSSDKMTAISCERGGFLPHYISSQILENTFIQNGRLVFLKYSFSEYITEN